MTTDKQPTIIIFDKCPNCGSTERLSVSLAEELKSKGLVDKDYIPHVLILRTIIGGEMVARGKIPIGSSLPAVSVFFDVCMNKDCGTFYPVRIEIARATILPGMPKQTM